MARWRLTQKHYLNAVDVEYEYKETNNYGKQIKRKFNVPMFLDPEDPGDCNYNYGGESRAPNSAIPGEIIVAWADGTERPRDIIFTGDPTPDMIPLDDAAKAISAEFAPRWGQAFVGSEDNEEGYSGKLLLELTETLNSFNATIKPSSPVADDSFKALSDKFDKVLEMNMALLSKLEPPARRV